MTTGKWLAWVVAAIGGGLLYAVPVSAELVLLVGGGVLKVEDYRVMEDFIELVLPSGGEMTLPMLRIDRILEDEIESTDKGLDSGTGIEVAFAESQMPPATPYGLEIFAAARRHAINPDLVAAVVQVESAFDPRAVSATGAAGLMQLMPSTAVRFGLELDWIFDPERNLDVGARYLRWLVDRFAGDVELALAGYNAGEAAVDRYHGVPPYRETHEYLRRVYAVVRGEDAAAETE